MTKQDYGKARDTIRVFYLLTPFEDVNTEVMN
jgi:hypothetical protein